MTKVFKEDLDQPQEEQKKGEEGTFKSVEPRDMRLDSVMDPLPNQFDDSVAFNPDGDRPKRTIAGSIRVNDGKLHLRIIAQDQIGSGTNKHTVYHMKGKDNLGDIDIMRRYREFDMFRECLFKRYPGLYIPPIPPKQA